MPRLDGLKPAQMDPQQLWSSPWTPVQTSAGLLHGHCPLANWLLLALETEHQATTAEYLLLCEGVGI